MGMMVQAVFICDHCGKQETSTLDEDASPYQDNYIGPSDFPAGWVLGYIKNGFEDRVLCLNCKKVEPLETYEWKAPDPPPAE